jgi:hypothetical protein
MVWVQEVQESNLAKIRLNNPGPGNYSPEQNKTLRK